MVPGYGFLFAFHSNHDSIFFYSLAFGSPRRNIATTLGMKKTRMARLPDGEKNFTIRLAYRILACDRPMDIHLATAWSALCIRVAR